ncbi:DinB family protein [Neobacillus sp. WH10]|uniref:DinB family protein n=1 Tax=Neobacillus sp. WH10 TaxID=3047873 RepID=UPI0024C1B08F|nr:DinB family protein [Neobacillus sp. WH10]WHY75447.1 DinB family protein [Neobacillus sp. WH10]
MYSSIAGFIEDWNQEAALTQSLVDALQNSSLQQRVSSDDRTLGRIAWHIVTSTPGMLIDFGIKVPTVENAKNVPESAKEIAGAFRRVSTDVAHAVKEQWTDSSLTEEVNVFGRTMTKAGTLSLIVKHIIHHRGQMTVLMRQAGVRVPGLYGPAREEWTQMGMNAPTI